VGRVIADTGPLQYLVLIGKIDLLPRLFGTVSVPAAVRTEMLHPAAPLAVRTWAENPPQWLTVVPEPAESGADRVRRTGRNLGERAVIALARESGAALLLIDDRAGVAAARAQKLPVIGTLGVLVRAARRDMIDLEEAFAHLKASNFRYPADLLASLLADDRKRRGKP
jgi:predicted nucleic acid-binding protein